MIKLNNLEETKEFGKFLGENLNPGDVLCLNGDLGAGKTTLTKSISKGLGIEDYVTSPTFSIVNEYYGKINLYHIDTYRLDEKLDVDYLGFDEYFYSDGVTIVEWAEKIRDALPEEYIEINISLKENTRELEINFIGDRFEKLKEKLNESFGD
ncbi:MULTISPECIES: tRNA (adenosine(37)-N6)-threonylcarbamoyltransferase complex ATPase subunit type 1 TsaE [Peptoniphilus]|jgi:hydrolase, P-loop family|uniref:tRNA (adenosine(37)-N6)-threonylcarbamoyltransferase complex ATPase subunit type 1 TsaE n=1 Tax=Peptoniphilus TaxID=162289 RepID=UPI000287FEE9|nr:MULTISPECIES: tRNA (adenosine(37)-N6)-threonylcarbamoyltransferase complex ATPase subunit type 1 TsaE [Peptoniphilus]MDU1043342.1 tRNA (adenosine(37)-N6)-threonylcarbamoyltransferase complex ATPase subunit type 1 TsaE [Peptoniphilus rhinitidis]MDU1954058.1 tRNA (adenosine(37)-N6)-threonylcarbamoyltransferase complex ATPase subunit type 1 TsaE [Peptoniphilus lacydonensis]MDU2109556.1 tRNA (adenosine(37)-N6)-threonylcarbamoyltransferase complex ATPase subunit type 1 TsaE [Peptoniphilus lacydone